MRLPVANNGMYVLMLSDPFPIVIAATLYVCGLSNDLKTVRANDRDVWGCIYLFLLRTSSVNFCFHKSFLISLIPIAIGTKPRKPIHSRDTSHLPKNPSKLTTMITV